jgi:hypothetical protein
MNKIVREHYPVENLPLDLQAAVGHAGLVTVIIEPEKAIADTRDASAILAEMEDLRDRLPDNPPVDGAARIRKLRDEWDN